jgi:SAM-dependent methyltransferase
LRPGHSDFREEWLDAAHRPNPNLLHRLLAFDVKHRSRHCIEAMVAELKGRTAGTPTILVIGGGEVGIGLGPVLRQSGIEWIETDIYVGSRTRLVADGHDLPFASGSFDGVVIQSVLEHVRDPVRVAAEAMRMLKPHGLLFSQAAFMQQVHEDRYDFFRFSPRAHRLLFAPLAVVSWGASLGPAVAFVWSLRYLLRALLAPLPGGRAAAFFLSRVLLLFAFPLDMLLARSRFAMEAASETYLLLRKTDPPADDADRFPDRDPQ